MIVYILCRVLLLLVLLFITTFINNLNFFAVRNFAQRLAIFPSAIWGLIRLVMVLYEFFLGASGGAGGCDVAAASTRMSFVLQCMAQVMMRR